MSAAAHVVAFLFAAPAGILAYCAIGLAAHPAIDMRHLFGAVVLFGLAIIGIPELSGAVVLYFAVGTILAALGIRITGQRRPEARRAAEPQGPQPPRRAIQVDRELAWDKRTAIHGRGDIDWDRLLRMMEALDRDEMEQLNQFWNWQRRTRDAPSQPDLPEPSPAVIGDLGDDADDIVIWTDQ